MVGFMDYERIEGMVEDVTDAVLEADGTAGTGDARVYVMLNEVPSGTSGVDGKVWSTVFTAETLGPDPAHHQHHVWRAGGSRRPVRRCAHPSRRSQG